jgi:HK97 family phage major capsid protein
VNPNHKVETALEREVGAKFSIAPGMVTAKDIAAYHVMVADCAMAKLPQASGRPWSATAALWDRKAPGAAAAKTHKSIGELVQALHRQACGTGPAVVNAAMGERVGAEGGFLVGEDLRTDLMMLALEHAIIRPRATVVPMREQRERIPVAEEGAHSATTGALGGFAFAWVQEGQAPSNSTPGLGNITLHANKLEGYTIAPNELFTDSKKLDSFLRTAIPAALSWYEDAAFFGGESSGYGSGTGAGTPQGILNAPCAILVTRQTGGSVTLQDVFSMVTRILPRSINNVVWAGSPDVTSKLLQMYLAVGSPTTQAITPGEWLTWSPTGQMQLLGRPYFSTEHVNALGTQGDLVCFDPSFYVIGDRLELTIDVALEGGTGFIHDEAEIRVKERVDGRVWLASAVTPSNASATVSPVVILK